MATTRKKQDDKHLKILRELVSIATNKQCFDCHQRGPTYVNMTIGSYVCTTCSGMLRGLTPPHRVKSISMATFNQEELEMMKVRGNEYCRRIWLGLYDSNSQDTKDEQQIKDFMIAKYEKKRYYLDPAVVATTNGGSASFSPTVTPTSTPTSSARKADAKPLSTLLGPQSKTLILNMNTSTKPADNMFTPDKSPAEFTADFESADPFSSSTQFNASNGTQASFANFDDNPIFNSFTNQLLDNVMRAESLTPRCNTNRWSMPTSTTLSNMYHATTFPSPPGGKVSSATVFQQQQQQQLSRGNLQQPVEDRYAALKDLDSLMKTNPPSEPQPAPASGNHMNNGFGMTANSVFGSPSQASGIGNQGVFMESSPANPFTGANADPWTTFMGGNIQPSAGNQSAAFGMNPFQPARAVPTGFTSGQVDGSMGGWGGIGMQNGQMLNGGHNGGAFTSSQSMNFPPKTWNSTSTANPFMLGTSPATTGHSSNPFL